MEKITIKSTSASSAITDVVVLRETSITRLIFKPMIVENLRDEEASVKGTFVFQRKLSGEEWVDHKELNLSQLKAEEWVKLELKSAEVLKLFRHLSDLYSIYQQEGIQFGETRFLRADEGLGAMLDANESDLYQLLNREPEDA